MTNKKRAARTPYHHGDLEAALLSAALRIVHQRGAEGLSIREVGTAAGVSRNALYRHYQSKAALLAKVAESGFLKLSEGLAESLNAAEKEGLDCIEEMSSCYVKFALSNSAHYKVMFGPLLDKEQYPGLSAAGASAFGALVRAVTAEQASGRLVEGNSIRLSQVIWAQVHGISLLGINGQLAHKQVGLEDVDELVRYAIRGMRNGLGTGS